MNHILLSELSEHIRQTAPCVSPTYVHSGPSQSPQLLPKGPADSPAKGREMACGPCWKNMNGRHQGRRQEGRPQGWQSCPQLPEPWHTRPSRGSGWGCQLPPGCDGGADTGLFCPLAVGQHLRHLAYPPCGQAISWALPVAGAEQVTSLGPNFSHLTASAAPAMTPSTLGPLRLLWVTMGLTGHQQLF